MTRPAPSQSATPLNSPEEGEFAPLLRTDQLVAQLRTVLPGGLSKRTVYQWLDMGCPHLELPGTRKKFAFVLDEVVAWLMSHRVEKAILPGGRRGSA